MTKEDTGKKLGMSGGDRLHGDNGRGRLVQDSADRYAGQAVIGITA